MSEASCHQAHGATGSSECKLVLISVIYILSIISTIFPVISLATQGGRSSADPNSPGATNTPGVSPAVQQACIVCIVFDFLTSIWGLFLAIPIAIAVTKMDNANPNTVVPANNMSMQQGEVQDYSQGDESFQEYQGGQGRGGPGNPNVLPNGSMVYYGHGQHERYSAQMNPYAPPPPMIQEIDVKQNQPHHAPQLVQGQPDETGTFTNPQQAAKPQEQL